MCVFACVHVSVSLSLFYMFYCVQQSLQNVIAVCLYVFSFVVLFMLHIHTQHRMRNKKWMGGSERVHKKLMKLGDGGSGGVRGIHHAIFHR